MFTAYPSQIATQSGHVNQDTSHFEHTSFDETVQRIRRAVAQDVEMDGPVVEPHAYLIVDTNILLHYLDVVNQFSADIEAQALPLMVIIPGAVLSELDRQKNRKDLAWFARRASTWILEKVKERKVVKGQTLEETLDASRQYYDPDRKNDLLIMDCCEYFARARQRPAFLCSADKILCIECEKRDIPTVLPTARWSSRTIMQGMFPEFPHLDRFAAHKVIYRPSSVVQQNVAPRPAPIARGDDDGMDIDDDGSTPETLLPSHALDSLHLQVIDHFRMLLQELVLRIGGPQVAGGGSDGPRSVHAPQFTRKHYLEWTAAECLEYLGLKRRLPASNPRLEVFLSLPYSGRGARRGQDWPRQSWEEALKALAGVGVQWDERSIGESLAVLRPHCENIFNSPMRPTGT